MTTCEYCKTSSESKSSCVNCGAPMPKSETTDCGRVKVTARYGHGWTDWNAMLRVDSHGKVTCLENEK